MIGEALCGVNYSEYYELGWMTQIGTNVDQYIRADLPYRSRSVDPDATQHHRSARAAGARASISSFIRACPWERTGSARFALTLWPLSRVAGEGSSGPR